MTYVEVSFVKYALALGSLYSQINSVRMHIPFISFSIPLFHCLLVIFILSKTK